MIEIVSLHRHLVKSCRGERVSRAAVGPLGLAHDRRWMVADESGRMVTGRQAPRLVCIEPLLEDGGQALRLSAPGMDAIVVSRAALTAPRPASVWGDDFTAWGGDAAANAWFSAFLGREVQLLYLGERSSRQSKKRPHLTELSFADSFPLLVLNTASLADLNARIGREMEVERFRPNLVVSGAAAFAEDGWQRLRIGEVSFVMEKPCERCVLTTVDPVTGELSADQEPLRTLAKFRKQPGGVMFCMNLRAENEGVIEVGMPVELLD